ncbi:Ank 2 domain containing protein [Asbolus verrucosus]|uniref:Ank 2 domain containing protein n=1 Tax=Asbolus verrucosus TaxID=1661398 RepID=A0A482VC90_ASBVE|nr:Ank 2 domain containing protein [Asbolus verrucosus]
MQFINDELGPVGPIGLLPETNPLFCAVIGNNLPKLKSLVESGHCVNSRNHRCNLLLNVAIEYKRIEIFDYLLSLNQIEIDGLDRRGRTPLLYAASEASDEYFALKLIEKGADVNMRDKRDATFLLRAVRRSDSVNTVAVGQLAIEKGADINASDKNGITPLFAACEMGNFDWICMLLYYGADVSIVPECGVLPVFQLSHNLPHDQLSHLREVLYDCTFDDTKITLQLSNLVGAMLCDTSVFSKILKITQDVSYDLSDIELLYRNLLNIKPEDLSLFVEKFGHVAKEMLENFPPLDMLRHISHPMIDFGFGNLDVDVVKMKAIFDVFLESRHVADFVQTSEPSHPIIFHLIDAFRRNRIFPANEEEEITKLICSMLSYGLEVTAADLHAVYSYYGYCQLFKILLHMDIDLTHPVTRGCIIPSLCFDPCKNIEDFRTIFPSSRVLNYYNHPKVKELFLCGITDEEIVAKVKNLPRVPRLVELSRNSARKFVVKRYNIKNSRQFYTVLKWLPIGEMNKRIIALEVKLY